MTEEIIARLRSLDLSDGGSHSRLSAIASCFYQPTFGWTKGACEALRDELVRLLGGVHDDSAPTAATCGACDADCDCHNQQPQAIAYDVLGNERHKAITELRKVCTELDESVWTWIEDVAIAIGAQDKQSDEYESMLPKITCRLIHLLGGDAKPTPQKSPNLANCDTENGGEVTITDELRKFKGHINGGLTPEMVLVLRAEINYIADRIDKRVEELAHDTVMWHDRAVDMRMERDELQEKCDRLKAKVEHQREQLAVYATMYDFDAIRALKRERNEHKHRADNAEGHVKSLERRLDVAHETYCALLNDAAREFRALTEERDELQASLRKIAERAGVPHDSELDEYSDETVIGATLAQIDSTRGYVGALEWQRDRQKKMLDDYDKTHIELPKDENDEYIHIGDMMDGYAKTIEVVELRYGRSGWMLISRDGNGYADTFAFAHHHDPTVEQVIRDLTLGKITEAQAIERIEGINGQG